MKLNINFNSTLEETINLCSPLADWFERNQETMVYEEEKISEYAKVQYYIDLQELQKYKDEEKSLVKKLDRGFIDVFL